MQEFDKDFVNPYIPNYKRNNRFRYDLFACFGDISQCLTTWFCAPCQACKLYARVKGEEETKCNECCVAMQIGSCVIRQEVKRRYGIPVDCCGDCCTSAFCGCCAQIQEVRELKAHGIPAGLFCND